MSDPLTPTAPGEGAEQPIPELRRLGQQLAQARQTAGISEEALTQRLRLAPRQLKALEEGDHTRLPEGVFVVALARRVADALHADVDEALQALRNSRLMRRPVPAVRPARGEGGAPAISPDRPPLSPARPAGTPAAGAPAVATRSAGSSGDGPATPDCPPRETRQPEAPRPTPVPLRSETLGADVTQRPGPHRWPLAALAALLAAGGLALAWLALSRPSPRGVSSDPAPAASPTPAPAATPAAAPPGAADSLRLQASEPSWVEVRDLAGRTLFEGTFTGEKRFPIGGGIEVIAGRPHAVRASVGAAPGVPLGGVADIRWKRFSAAGPAAGSPPSPAPSP